MSDAGSFHDYIETVRLRIPRGLHPAGLRVVHDYLNWAHYHADCGNSAEAVRYLELARRKIIQELRWHAESLASGHAYHDAWRTRRRAERLEARP